MKDLSDPRWEIERFVRYYDSQRLPKDLVPDDIIFEARALAERRRIKITGKEPTIQFITALLVVERHIGALDHKTKSDVTVISQVHLAVLAQKVNNLALGLNVVSTDVRWFGEWDSLKEDDGEAFRNLFAAMLRLGLISGTPVTYLSDRPRSVAIPD